MSDVRSTPPTTATALARHLACGHYTQLELQCARGERTKPTETNTFLQGLAERGEEHEAAHIAKLEAAGKQVVELPRDATVADTLEAMARRVDVIAQAPVAGHAFRGRADFLTLAGDTYEPEDAKLTAETKAGTILQLCVYAECLVEMGLPRPRHVHVVTPLGRETYETADFAAYFRFVREDMATAVRREPETYPDPVPHCDVCEWWEVCTKRREDDDHLCRVAGILPLHRRELQRQDVPTLKALASMGPELPVRPLQGHADTYARLHHQARLQHASIGRARPLVERIDPVADTGFFRLPEPSEGDVFLDFEGDPFVGPPGASGLEYLTGWVVVDRDATPYREVWASTFGEEKAAFEQFMDEIAALRRRCPGMHIYHFGHYEATALKRMATRHGTRESELDQLLRGGLLIDLHGIVRESVRAGVERYGLKEFEAITGFTRKLDLREAASARRRVELALETKRGDGIPPELRDRVIEYNREDCESTLALRDWLEAQRSEAIAGGAEISRPAPRAPEPSEDIAERDRRIEELCRRLQAGISNDPDERSDEESKRWLLGDMLGYFRREEKCAWWEHFRLRGLDAEQLVDEREALSELVHVEQLPRESKAKEPKPQLHRYRFPAQESAVCEGKELHLPAFEGADRKLGTVDAIDLHQGTVDIVQTGKERDYRPRAVFRGQVVNTDLLEGQLLRFAEHVLDHGLVGGAQYSAAIDLLARRPPRRAASLGGALRAPGESALDAARRVCAELDGGTLPIQGPPGAGKSYTGARMILDEVRRGRTVGVTAVSHAVVDNLLLAVHKAAQEEHLAVELIHGDKRPKGEPIRYMTSRQARAAAKPGAVVGGTAWLWARQDAPPVDVLFVDEAGQMALAQVLAAACGAKNVVLLGDPQQLEQPSRGAHPEGADVAALVHAVGRDRRVIAPEQGLFLDKTYRLPPKVCEFTSQAYYDGQLSSNAHCARQKLMGETPFAGSGLFLVDVDHQGCQASSLEEVAVVEQIVRGLLEAPCTFTDRDGDKRRLEPKDILVVAPYNAQVSRLAAALAPLGVAKVGTVDRFQGREEAVVLYSCTSSSAHDAPRGMSFLYDPHRFNVATSRTQAIAIVVANPRLFEPECRTPEQMRMANGLCLYREIAARVELS